MLLDIVETSSWMFNMPGAPNGQPEESPPFPAMNQGNDVTKNNTTLETNQQQPQAMNWAPIAASVGSEQQPTPQFVFPQLALTNEQQQQMAMMMMNTFANNSQQQQQQTQLFLQTIGLQALQQQQLQQQPTNAPAPPMFPLIQQQSQSTNPAASSVMSVLSSKFEPVSGRPGKTQSVEHSAAPCKRKFSSTSGTSTSCQNEMKMYQSLVAEEWAPTPWSELQDKPKRQKVPQAPQQQADQARLPPTPRPSRELQQLQEQVRQLQGNMQQAQQAATMQQESMVQPVPVEQPSSTSTLPNLSPLEMMQQLHTLQNQIQQNASTDNPLAGQIANLQQQIPPGTTVFERQSNNVPSTLMPPSVMTSLLDNTVVPKHQPVDPHKKRQARKRLDDASPQEVLEQILIRRGLIPPGKTAESLRIRSEDSTYDTTPSPLQLASFGTEVVKSVHKSDTNNLHSLLRAGLSPNPCNQFRDSVVDLVCKRANAAIFAVLMEHGCDVRVCDGFGRTPLHHCCWANVFCAEIVGRILQIDPQQLFMEDKRGQTPLEYVRADVADDWIEYFEDNFETLFPLGQPIPTSTKQTRKHIPDPPNALPIRLAQLVSGGQMTPEQAVAEQRESGVAV